MNGRANHHYLIVFLVALILSLPFLNRGLFETSEGRYAMVAKTMNESGNFWMPQLNGKNHLTKPPLTYWIISLGQKILGNNTIGSRIMHMFTWLIIVLLIVRIGELLHNKETGLIMGLIFSTGLFPSLGHSFLTTDPILVAFQIFSFWAMLEFKNKPRPIFSFLFWLGLGLAFNTKGPVALFPIIFWIVFEKKTIREMTSAFSLLIFFVSGTFWYIGLEIQKKNILMELFQNEIIKRSSTDFSGRNPFWWAPLVTYLIPFIIGWGLWPFFMRKQLLVSTLQKKENRLYIFWIIGTLLTFSFIQSRLVLYILPLALPATVILAQALNYPSLKKAFICNFILLFTIKLFISIAPFDSNAKQISDFSTKNPGRDKIYFVNEFLYGVEFYMGEKFKRFTTNYGIHDALDKKEKIQWIAFQDKRKKVVDHIIAKYHKKIIEHEKQGKWNLVQITDEFPSNIQVKTSNLRPNLPQNLDTE